MQAEYIVQNVQIGLASEHLWEQLTDLSLQQQKEAFITWTVKTAPGF